MIVDSVIISAKAIISANTVVKTAIFQYDTLNAFMDIIKLQHDYCHRIFTEDHEETCGP